MPILCDPSAVFPVYLSCDETKPLAQRPTFIAKAQSMRGQMKIAETIDSLTDSQLTVAELFDRTLERLGEVFIGWKNMPQAYSLDALAESVNYSEARELLRNVLYASQIEHDEKKD